MEHHRSWHFPTGSSTLATWAICLQTYYPQRSYRCQAGLIHYLSHFSPTTALVPSLTSNVYRSLVSQVETLQQNGTKKLREFNCDAALTLLVSCLYLNYAQHSQRSFTCSAVLVWLLVAPWIWYGAELEIEVKESEHHY